MTGLLSPLFRALAQLDDPVFLGVVWRSLRLGGGLLHRPAGRLDLVGAAPADRARVWAGSPGF